MTHNKNDPVGKDLVMRKTAPGDLMAGAVPDRATRVASWIGWHLFELTGVTVPAVMAVAVSPWAWLVSGAVGASWTVHDIRAARHQAAIKAGRDLPAVATAPAATDVYDDHQADETSPAVDRTGTEGGSR
jgi:hypothetical protein